MRFTYLSAITTGLQAIATILSAVRVITSSIRSLTSVSQAGNEYVHTEQRKNSGLGLHKWILLGGALVGAITIAYLETMVASSKSKVANKPKQNQEVETVYVTE